MGDPSVRHGRVAGPLCEAPVFSPSTPETRGVAVQGAALFAFFFSAKGAGLNLALRKTCKVNNHLRISG